MNENVLLVDDNIQVLNSLKRLLIMNEYNVSTTINGEEALVILKNNKIDLLITDIKIPGLNALELLRKTKSISPSTIRIILSGYANEEILLKIKQNNLAKLYMLKPWNNNELLANIKQIFNIKNKLEQKNLLQIIDNIKALPSPDNVYRDFELMLNRDADMHEFANLIESDPSIAAKLLQVANSAFYGIKTGSVKIAITYLGLINVKNIIFSVSLYNNQKKMASNQTINDDIEILWKHSVYTNKILNFLYVKILNKNIPDIISMVGLLHDIGKFVLINNFSEKYLEATKKIRNSNNMLYLFEHYEFMNITHEEIGAYLLNWWELPQAMVEAVLYHHGPITDSIIDKELSSLLYISDIISWNIVGNLDIKIDEHILNSFSLTDEVINELIEEIKLILNN